MKNQSSRTPPPLMLVTRAACKSRASPTSLMTSPSIYRSPPNTVSFTSIIDDTGSGIARRIVLKTGLNVILACNIPKDSLMLEANAEKKLVEKLIGLRYTRPKAS